MANDEASRSRATLGSILQWGDAFHLYGVWWVDATTMRFYHNDQCKFTLKPDTTYSGSLFIRPMQKNMVTETYDWETPPSKEDLDDDTINTTYYEWVRSCGLVPRTNDGTHTP